MKNRPKATQAIRCLVIDDDPFIRDLLLDKLNQYFPEIKILGTAKDGRDGLERIVQLKPNLIFLDVEMTDMTGFEMLSRLKSFDFKVIFITSYKHYAIKAIRFNALDYLLKPFDLEELKNAVKRYKTYQNQNNLSIALNNLRSKTVAEQTLMLNTQQGELHLALKDIVLIEGDRNYSYVHLTKNRKELVSKTLSYLEELLEEKGFFRCHKSYLVNKIHILSVSKSFEISLSNNTKIPISRRKKEAFNNWFNN
ncbi:LytR/AlgR family response regulator transcription factor [Flavobacteriaceae bacterium LMO-SS05]